MEIQNQPDTSAKIIMSLDYVIDYLNKRFPHLSIKSVTPYSFTIGSNNQGEGLSQTEEQQRTLFFGLLNISINPNDNALAPEKIEIKYRSYFNPTPYFKTITRQVESENLINESSQSYELFDSLTISQSSTKYDFYLTFIGFKIDYN
jgi:hypothetical protein